MDFFRIKERRVESGRGPNKTLSSLEIYPDFIVGQTKDLMVRGKSFYAIWDEEKKLWSRNEFDVQRLVDDELYKYRDALLNNSAIDAPIVVKSMANTSSGSWKAYRRYVSDSPDNYVDLDTKLIFADTKTKREDYASRRLPYSLEDGDYSAWDELVSKLYSPPEREKIEWSIGSIVSGDSKKIEKFLVLYGSGGTGKSTILKIVEKLFQGYTIPINAKAIGNGNNRFAMELFRSNPLVAIDQDSKMDRIEDNTKLNSIISHDVMIVDEKGKPTYPMQSICFLMMGTNTPVKITDGRSGLIRRLIVANPTGEKFPPAKYQALRAQIDFELGSIANHCLNVYRDLGANYYDDYKETNMMGKTNMLYNFVYDNQDQLSDPEGISLARAYTIYKDYCKDSNYDHIMYRYQFKDELKVYFNEFSERGRINGEPVRSWFSGFKSELFDVQLPKKKLKPLPMVLDSTNSILDELLADCPAQYAVERDGRLVPEKGWRNVKTVLRDLDTTKPHYIHGKALTDMGLVTVDFDLKDENGNKNMLLNLEAASKWPKTYAEFSQGGNGIHLEYFYKGDLDKLSPIFGPGIEVKVFKGNEALRRKLSKCNDIPIAFLSGGLPLKEEKVLDVKSVQDEKHLINLIAKSLRKENTGCTKTEIDFIDHLLNQSYASGIHYDVSDMRGQIVDFAIHSSNNKDYCFEKALKMKYWSKDLDEYHASEARDAAVDRLDERKRLNGKRDNLSEEDKKKIVFFDCEVFPNLFLINWKFAGEGQPIHRMINPTPSEVEELFGYLLVGFNCRKYDNHMLYGRYMGLSNADLYDLSQRIIVEGARDAFYPEAYDISYTDIYDYAKTKQSLKKWEIELGLYHKENQYALPPRQCGMLLREISWHERFWLMLLI